MNESLAMWFGYGSLTPFERARWRARRAAGRRWLQRRPAPLLPFEAVRSRLHVRGQQDRGRSVIPLNMIVGSEGRHLDFDREFAPCHNRTQDRWERVDRAYHDNLELPPVELYRLGDTYFVSDGHHRISVAWQRGSRAIDARVIKLEIDVPLTPDLNLADLDRIEQQSNFFEWTDLARLRPDSNIVVSGKDRYLDLIREINRHRVQLSIERMCETPRHVAVADWYDRVYLPVVRVVCRMKLLTTFADHTEADLYLRISDDQRRLRAQQGRELGVEEAVRLFVLRYGSFRARRRLPPA